MDWKELEALQSSYVTLVESVDPTEIMPILIQEKAVTVDEKETIDSCGARHKKAAKLIDILMTKKRECGFRALCLGLQRNLQEFLVDELLQKVEEYEKRGPPKDWLVEKLTDRGRGRQVSELELSQIAQEMGHVWMAVGRMMGFKQGRLEQFQASSPYYLPNQASKMLMEWRTRDGKQATIENLVRIFRNSNVEEDCYKQVILDHSNSTEGYVVL